MSQSATFVVSHPKAIIAATLAITIGFAAAILARGLSFNGSPETLARNDSALEYFNQVRSTFGDDRVIIVALTTSDVFTEEFLAKLSRLTSSLAAIRGVDEALSLANIKAIKRTGDGIRIERLFAGYDSAYLSRLKEEVTRNPLYARHYVSLDGRTAAISLFLKQLDEQETRTVAEEVERVARSEAGADELLLAGIPIMDARAISNMVRDMVICSPVAALLCIAVFSAAFRSLWGALLPMFALIIGLIWTFGSMVLLGRPVTFATLPLPTTLMAVGSSYIFHVLNQYRISMSALDERVRGRAAGAAWLDGLRFITPAVLVSGTTTMAGFGSLASSSVPTARDMGAFEALGVAFMLMLSLGFVPAVLALLSPQALSKSGTGPKDYALWLNDWLRSLTALILFRGRAVLVVSLLATLLIGIGMIWLRVNTDYLRIFPESSETVQAAQKLHERLAGAATLQIVVSGAPGSALKPSFLDATSSLEEFALSQPGVDAAISIAGIARQLEGLLKGPGNPSATEANNLPYDRNIVSDLLTQDETIYRLVSRDHSQAIIVLRTNLFGSNELRELTGKIDLWARANLPAGTSARATGSFVLLNDASDAVADSQWSSLAIALASIYLMMAVLFRSFSTALLALIPNLLPIVCYFGFLGWAGIALDITTSLVASAALGLAVDNAVHMIRRYRQSVAERGSNSAGDEGWVLWLTMLRTGKPMTLANLMLLAAFLIFVLSSFVPVRLAGELWAVTILACLAANLIFLPALMRSKPFARIAIESAPASEQADDKEYADLGKLSK